MTDAKTPLGDRAASAVASAAIRLSLIRMALRRRDNMPELVVLALHESKSRSRRDW